MSLLNMMCSLKPRKNYTEENVFLKIEQIETKFENLKVSENVQYFLATFVSSTGALLAMMVCDWVISTFSISCKYT